MSKKNFPKETIRIKRRKETVWFVFAQGLKFGEVKGKPIKHRLLTIIQKMINKLYQLISNTKD